MLRATQQQGCHILVGTPGRLADVLSDPGSGIRTPKLSVWVLDEADRLLDDGFWPEIRNIESMLPDRQANNIQSMMFSATVPEEVVAAVRATLKPGFRFVKCVREGEVPTHERVPQQLVRTAGFQNNIPALIDLALREIEKNKQDPTSLPFKAIVYFNSTAMVELADKVLQNLGRNTGTSPLYPARIFGIHSKLTQAGRTNASDGFRRAKSGILLSSDVTARGMDFPNVTHVVQVGLPQTADIYVHRIGRTARAGKPGTGVLLMSPLEEGMARKRLGHLPLQPDNSLAAASVDMTKAGQIPARVASILTSLAEAHRAVPRDVMASAYRSLLGGFQWLDDKQALIDAMNQYARFGWGLSQPPALQAVLVQRLGLSRVNGINTMNERPSMSRDRGMDYERGSRNSGFGGDSQNGDAFDRVGFGAPQRRDASDRAGYGGRQGSGFRQPPRKQW